MRRQPHHHRLGDNEPAGHRQIAPHGVLTHLQAAEHFARMFERAGGHYESLGKRVPLHVPLAGGALVILHQSVEHAAVKLAHDLRCRQQHLRSDGIALLRHGGAGAAAGNEGLVHFADLRLHHQHDVVADLAQRARDQRQQTA